MGYALALAATLLWAGNVIASVYLADDFAPGFLSLSRWVIGAAAFAPFVLLASHKATPCSAGPSYARGPAKTQHGALRRDAPRILISGVLGIALFNLLFYTGAGGTTALNLGLIAITVPVFILGIDRFYFGVRTTARQKLGFALVTGGILGTVAKGDLEVLRTLSFGTADAWVLAAAAVFSVYSVVVSQGERHLPADVFQFATFLVGLVVITPFAGYEFARSGWPTVTAPQAWALLYVGVGASLLAYQAWAGALRILGPTRAGLLYNTLPIFSTALAYWLLDEGVTGPQALAGGLVIAGVLVTVGEREGGGLA